MDRTEPKTTRPGSDWQRPKRFDRNLVVIGAGSAGLVSAYIAAAAKAKVTLVEANKMGGDCLNFGCVPSKALIQERQGGAPDAPCRPIRSGAGRAEGALLRGDGADPQGDRRDRAARQRGALHRPSASKSCKAMQS